MSVGLVGRKRGMTRVFDADGTATAVTVVEVGANRVVTQKTAERDGYRAIQVTAGSRARNRLNAPETGHFRAAGVEAGDILCEFRLSNEESFDELEAGAELTVDRFQVGQFVDVVGRSIGKGYGGVIKRHNFRSQRSTHGNAKSHRAPGSIGQNQSPGHVFKGKKMAGQLGNARTTLQNLRVVRADSERGVLLVAGSVPGPKNGYVELRPAVKKVAPEASEG
ncbi:50S ribosomal protein L3 [Salinisphaera sp. USBA-960]|uniref:50S ribosomal protein L3 n=1 Tax=Salinisphaera orenii TaxID=856731 RepID=UPI000DBE220F|nr:50S ribosomal protein L3 [Salifodinibacter halophilus]NNC26692.1 50S ribosomal protein L3 [Salifodinibacter halophilus]